MYEVIAITVAIVISIFNFVFTCSVAKVVLNHAQIISLLVKHALLLDKLYLSSNTTTDKEDKKWAYLNLQNYLSLYIKKIKHLHRINWDIVPDFDTQTIVLTVPSIDAVYVWKVKENVLEAHSREEFYSERTTYYKEYDLKRFIKVMKRIIKGKGYSLAYRY